MRFSEIGNPILPTPTKPTVSIPAPEFVCCGRSRDVERLVGEIHLHAERSLHQRPFAHLEGRSLLTTNGSVDATARASSALAARRMVSPSPAGAPGAAVSGPDANSTPCFSSPIMYSR